MEEHAEAESDGACGPNRIARRAALRAALAGGAAGAAYVAPRIEGLSVVPEYASAATCLPGTTTRTRTGSGGIYCAAKINCDAAHSNHSGTVTNTAANYSCWGSDGGHCDCNTVGLTVVNFTLGGNSVTINSSLTGRSNTRGNCSTGYGYLSVNVAGLAGNRKCNVSISSSPNELSGSSVANVAFNADGNQTNRAESASNGTSAQTATITYSCTC